MSLTFGFFNSQNNDRVYNSDTFSSIFDGAFNDGVFPNFREKFFVRANGDMTISVSSGRAWFNHTWTLNDSDFVMNLNSPNAAYSRIDAIVLEVNKNSRENTIKAITGTNSINPAKPALIRSDDVYQYAFAYVTIPAGSGEVLQSNIENVVGSSETPYVSVNGIDTETIKAELIESFSQDSSIILEDLYPVNSIYISVNNVDPAILFGGVWEEIVGRFLIGAGVEKDVNDVSRTFNGGDALGEYEHTLTTDEMPSHNHGGTVGKASHTHTYVDKRMQDYHRPTDSWEWTNGSGGINRKHQNQDEKTTTSAGSHTHTLTGMSSAGEDQPHNNLPPYLAVHIWKRVA